MLKDCFKIVVVGSKAGLTALAIKWLLEKNGAKICFGEGSANTCVKENQPDYCLFHQEEISRELAELTGEMAVVLPLATFPSGLAQEKERQLHRFLRNFPYKKAVVVAFGEDSLIRKASRGYSYKFRWFFSGEKWTGLRLPVSRDEDSLFFSAAARVGHELGLPNHLIKGAWLDFPDELNKKPKRLYENRGI